MVSTPLGIRTPMSPRADDYPVAADGRVAAALLLPVQVTDLPEAPAMGGDLLRDQSVARDVTSSEQASAEQATEQTVAAMTAAALHDGSGVAKPVQESSASADIGGPIRHWLALVHENVAVSWKLAPAAIALGLCAWQARLWRKRPGEDEIELPSAAAETNPLRRLTQ